MKKAQFVCNFRAVEFAVYCVPWDDRNYVAFKNVLTGK